MSIILDHVTKRYGEQTVVKDLCLEFKDGESYILTGPSGSGKTTVLRLILGLERPDHGSVRVPAHALFSRGKVTPEAAEGSRETSAPTRKRLLHAGCVFQEDRLAEDSTAADNLKAVCRSGDAEIRSVLRELLPEEAAGKPVRELSGGMKRRVCLARACLSDAGILILDEPFTGLDEETRRDAIRFLQKHRRGRTLIMAGHSVEGLEFCQEIRVGTKL